MDFFEEKGILAIASRLRRLTEALTRDDAEIYRMAGLTFKPKWFPVFLTLADGEAHTVTSIAKRIGQTHPSVSVMIRELAEAGLVEEKKNAGDGRSTQLRLSAEGTALLPVFEELCRDVEAAALSVCRDAAGDLPEAVRGWEKALAEKSLLTRVQEIRRRRRAQAIRIVPWNERYREEFVRLSLLWISRYFTVEPADEKQLADPYSSCIASGGEIFCAVDTATGKVAGVCALIFHPAEKRWELAKLCVDPEYRGLGIGGRLVDAVVELAWKKSARELFLVSNRILAAAIALYRKKGFVEMPPDESEYRRADIQMVMPLCGN